MRARAGFTLVEMAIALAILGMVTASIVQLTTSTSEAYRTVDATIDADAQGHRALLALKDKLRGAATGSIDPRPAAPLWTSAVELQRITGYAGELPVWGALERLELRYDLGDPDDGVDNDGDGLVDECELWWIEDVGGAAEREFRLVRDVREYLAGEAENGLDDNGNGLVDERGACFSFGGTFVTVRLTLERMDQNGFEVGSSYETSVALLPIDL